MIPADEDFDGTWPFAPRFCDAAGFRQHYVDVAHGPGGQPEDAPGSSRRPLVLLHGQPTWGYV